VHFVAINTHNIDKNKIAYDKSVYSIDNIKNDGAINKYCIDRSEVVGDTIVNVFDKSGNVFDKSESFLDKSGSFSAKCV
jgi:hypothetical protein